MAAFLPGDAITLVLETVPLYLLYEASILLASLVERRERKRGERQPPGSGQPPAGGSPAPNDRTQPSVQQMIDHFDRKLTELMLFDLRGRGRRRTVQAIYLGLALLIGSGLVFFGVGAGVGGGGLLNSLTGNESSGSTSFSSQIKKYNKLTQQQPSSVYAWEQLTLAQLHEAGGEAYIVNGKLTSKGTTLFTQVAQSWNRYIALNPPKPNAEIAQEMVRVFGEEGLDQPAEAVKVLQIVTAARPESAGAVRVVGGVRLQGPQHAHRRSRL